MRGLSTVLTFAGAALLCVSLGCQSPYHADRGAAFGAATGGVLGAIVGEAAADNPLAGAAIGAVAGGITGNAVGQSMDEMEARNRAMIEAQLGQQIQAGAVTNQDVIMMTREGVATELIVNHVNANGVAVPLSAQDIVQLQRQGVSPDVIAAMQNPSNKIEARPVVVRERAPVIVEEHYWGPRYRPYYYHHHCYPRRRAGVHIGYHGHL